MRKALTAKKIFAVFVLSVSFFIKKVYLYYETFQKAGCIKMTDKELMMLFASDSAAAMRAAIDLYGNLIYTIIKNRMGRISQREDIEESVSDVFVLFYRSIDKIDLEKGSIKSYLSAIANRYAIKRAKKLFSESAAAAAVSRLIKTSSDADEEILQKEERRLLLDGIKALGKPDSDIIAMKYFYGLKSKEIGKILGIKTNTVDKRTGRALDRLRKILDEEA